MDSLKILGILSLSEVQTWRNVLGDSRFSQVLGYISSRIIDEDLENFGRHSSKDIQLIIEYLSDIVTKTRKSPKKFITQKEFDLLCESLIDGTLYEMTKTINFADIGKFLFIQKFRNIPQNLLYRSLLFKSTKRFDEHCKAVSIELLNENLKYKVLDEIFSIDDASGHALDLIELDSPDVVLFDNSITRVVESENKKLLKPMVNLCFEKEKSVAGIMIKPETTTISEILEKELEKNWVLPRKDSEILKYIINPGEFTRIFRDVDSINKIQREFIYFLPHETIDSWRVNNYWPKTSYSILNNAVKNITVIPIINKLRGIISTVSPIKYAYQNAFLKERMQKSVHYMRTGEFKLPSINEVSIKDELIDQNLKIVLKAAQKDIDKSIKNSQKDIKE
ncbi:MAG: hypothetical protein EAX96_01510 [Candidatus Lokiarchaeota archaeon]|nr:hypothetical protein [Candidatus Lokiarchaeota archaeon]